MKPKHTPGPWKVSGPHAAEFGSKFFCIEGDDGKLVTSVDNYSEQGQANAALIAAAPELLGQLKNAAAELRCAAEILRRAKVTGWNTTLTIAERAEAAIAKAEGREE